MEGQGKAGQGRGGQGKGGEGRDSHRQGGRGTQRQREELRATGLETTEVCRASDPLQVPTNSPGGVWHSSKLQRPQNLVRSRFICLGQCGYNTAVLKWSETGESCESCFQFWLRISVARSLGGQSFPSIAWGNHSLSLQHICTMFSPSSQYLLNASRCRTLCSRVPETQKNLAHGC